MASILTATTAAYTAQTLRGTAKVDEVARADSEVDLFCTADWANDVDADLESVNAWFAGGSSAGIAGNTSTLLGRLKAVEGMVIGNNTDADIVFDSGAGLTPTVRWDNGTNSDDGGIRYGGGAGSEIMVFRARNSDRLGLHSTAMYPTTDDQLWLGGSSNNYKGLYIIDGVTAPGTPSTGAVLYVDSITGDLTCKFSDGFTATVAADA